MGHRRESCRPSSKYRLSVSSGFSTVATAGTLATCSQATGDVVVNQILPEPKAHAIYYFTFTPVSTD
jgi:hypothetical protein